MKTLRVPANLREMSNPTTKWEVINAMKQCEGGLYQIADAYNLIVETAAKAFPVDNRNRETLDERDGAVILANRVLDIPYKDPDDTECILARQYLRALEKIQRLTKLLDGVTAPCAVKRELDDKWPEVI